MRILDYTSMVLFFPIEQWIKFAEAKFSDKDRKMQVLMVYIPENVLSLLPKFS